MNTLPNSNTIHIKENRITLFYFFNEEIKVENFNEQLLKDIGLPGRLNSQIDKQLNKQKLWTEFSYNITKDIKKNIHALFHVKDKPKPINSWHLNKLAIKLLNGKQVGQNKGTTEAYKKPGLQLNLSKAAQARLVTAQHEDSPQLNLEDIVLHQFKTGYSVATIELSISNQNPSYSLINEAVYALSRFNKISWRNVQGKNESVINQKDYSLGDLIRDLLQTEKRKRHTRVYTHSYIQLQDTTKQLDIKKYLGKLSLHLNDEYLFNNTNAVETIQDYDNICHCLAQEGAASCVTVTEQSPEFLLNYTDNVIRQVHIPIHLLLFHAEQAMEEYQTNSQQWLGESAPDPILLQKLQHNRQQLINFELNFFQPVISNIEAHNRLHHSIIKVKRLEQQHKKISQNQQIISQIIIDSEQQKTDAENSRKNLIYCRVASMGIVAAGYLTSFSILKELLNVRKHEHWGNKQFPEMMYYLDHHIGAISVFGALFIAFIALIYTYKHCACAEPHHKHTASDYMDHANHVIHSLHLNDKH